MKSEIFKKVGAFWDTLEDWTVPTSKVFSHHESINYFSVSEMYEECLNFTDWIHANADPATVPSSFREHMMSIGESTKEWKRWFALPTEEHFPRIYEFLQNNKFQYTSPVISKLGAGEHIRVHNHGGKGPPYIYNMSLNYPEGCKFAVYPQGVIPYKAGDIYRVYIHNDHAVVNNSDTDRYHMMMRPVAWK